MSLFRVSRHDQFSHWDWTRGQPRFHGSTLCRMTGRVTAMREGQWIESYVPAQLDRLPWTRQHWLIVFALGATWILDGLEVTLASAVGAMLTHSATLGLSATQVGATATCYLAGAVAGAIVFGYATDRL